MGLVTSILTNGHKCHTVILKQDYCGCSNSYIGYEVYIFLVQEFIGCSSQRLQKTVWYVALHSSAICILVFSPLIKFKSHNRWANYPLNKHYVLAFMFSVYQLKMQILDYEYLDFINWINKMYFFILTSIWCMNYDTVKCLYYYQPAAYITAVRWYEP